MLHAVQVSNVCDAVRRIGTGAVIDFRVVGVLNFVKEEESAPVEVLGLFEESIC